jgi:hypothetical protein
MTDPNFFTGKQLVALMRRFFRYTVGEGEQVSDGYVILPEKGRKNRKIFTDGGEELSPMKVVLSGKKLLGYSVEGIATMCLRSRKKSILRVVRSSDGLFTITAEKKDHRQYVLTNSRCEVDCGRKSKANKSYFD